MIDERSTRRSGPLDMIDGAPLADCAIEPTQEHPAWSEADLLAALTAAGIAQGDLLFVQADLDTLGPPRGGDSAFDYVADPAADSAADSTAERSAGARSGPTRTAPDRAAPDRAGMDRSAPERAAIVWRALRRAVGEGGTVVVPTYTFSFCRQEDFDTARSLPTGGPWSPSADFLTFVLRQPGVVRSRDPIHSVAAIGPAAATLLRDLPPTCFGLDSVQHRLRRAGGKIVAIGVGPHESTLVHHAEAMMRVPFRFRKLFTGRITDAGETRREGWIADVRILAPNSTLDGTRIAHAARAGGVLHTEPIGRGCLHVAPAQPFYDVLCRALAADPWFTVTGPPGDPIVLEAQRVDATPVSVDLPPDAPMDIIVERLCPLRRDIVSDGYDAALAALGTQVPMQVHEYPSGTECFTWIVPEKWTCHEAWLETMDGQRLFSYDDHPLHVVSYSLPFEGVVSRDELMRHLHVHERLPDAVPFIFKYYERDWGLCCSRQLRDRLADPHYRVVIRTSFSYGTLKVGEVRVPGTSDASIVLCTHLCHPGMAMDDLSGVAVGIDVMRALLRRPTPPRYTYRLLILPETIGSLAWLSGHTTLIPRLAGGIFLEMLGLDHPHVLQHSFAHDAAHDTEIDACCAAALRGTDPYAWETPYRELIGNDERQFNAPGVRVPMLALLRVLPPSHPEYPYREYHSSHDTPAIVSMRRLQESRDLLLQMIDTLEANRVPVNRFAGEVCCSRYGLHIDWWTDPEGHRALFRIMDLIDGTRSIVQIAKTCGVRVDTVTRVLDALHSRGLIDYRSH